jgi:hypothetical protein
LEAEFQYVDLFDESDALLRHKYQLIYAVGSAMELKAGPERWYMVQVVRYCNTMDILLDGICSTVFILVIVQ